MIRDGLRRDPITSALTALIGAWMLWFSLTLLTFPITPVRRHSFGGPTEIFGLRGWGVVFLIGAACQLARLLTLRWHRVSIALNGVPTVITAAWAFGWLTGPESTGQPAYAFIAAIVLLHPWLRLLVDRYYKVTWIE